MSPLPPDLNWPPSKATIGGVEVSLGPLFFDLGNICLCRTMASAIRSSVQWSTHVRLGMARLVFHGHGQSMSTLIRTSPIVLVLNAIVAPPIPTTCASVSHRGTDDNVRIAVSQVSVSLVFFATVRHLLWYGVLAPSGLQWKETTATVLGALVSAVHSSSILLPVLGCVLTHPTKVPSSPCSASSPAWNHSARTMLSFTTAYMIQDTIMTVCYTYDTDCIIIVHHLACMLYVAITRLIGAGHYTAMMAILIGEVTNPLHNVHHVLQHLPRLHEWMIILRPYVTVAFGATFILVRFVVFPILIWVHMKDIMFSPKSRIPLYAGSILCIICIGIMAGSVALARTLAYGALFAFDESLYKV